MEANSALGIGFGSTDRRISYGDKIFARLVLGGKTICEFVMAQIHDFTELLGILRKQAKGVRGLARLYVRNASQGWSVERPMMLYLEGGRQSRMGSLAGGGSLTVSAAPERRMLFPWETH